MEANEAPEKIFILPDDRNSNGLSICWYEAPYCTGAIEYTCTDAFLKKLEEWLDEYISDWVNVETPTLVGSFKNYTEGKLDYGW